MKVSTATPFYKEERLLAEALKSVCAMELEGTEKEVVICYDGLTDGTPDIIDPYLRSAPEIIKVQTPLPNLGKARPIVSLSRKPAEAYQTLLTNCDQSTCFLPTLTRSTSTK